MSGKLTMHVRTHTNEKPYICKYCGQKFEQVNLKKDHEKTVHENRKNEKEPLESKQDNMYQGKCWKNSWSHKKSWEISSKKWK